MAYRIQPVAAPAAYRTYRLAAPLATHWRTASCAEVDCQHHLHGWATTVLAGSADEALVRQSGRRWTAERLPGGMVRYVFPAGQRCFAASTHRLPLDRPARCLVRGGDWRANLGVVRDHGERTDLWVEDFATHQNKIIEAIERG